MPPRPASLSLVIGSWNAHLDHYYIDPILEEASFLQGTSSMLIEYRDVSTPVECAPEDGAFHQRYINNAPERSARIRIQSSDAGAEAGEPVKGQARLTRDTAD
jgi:hypothetical protein